MDPISKVKISDTSYEIKDGTARLAIVTLNNELSDKVENIELRHSGIYDAQVEYLQSSGTQYIDTGIVASQDLYSEVDCSIDNGTSDVSILGTRSGDTRMYLLHRASSAFCIGYGNYYTGGTFANNTRYLAKTSLKPNIQTLNVDGTTIIQQNQPSISTSTNLYLFASNALVKLYSNAKIWSCKIKQGDVLVRDFIPVRVGQVGYMYDKVSGQLFGNAGTGSFTFGNDIEDGDLQQTDLYVDDTNVGTLVTSYEPSASARPYVAPSWEALTNSLYDKIDKVVSTDNAVVRFDGTSGAIQNSGVTINDSDEVTADSFIMRGGTSSQFLKADGSVDGTSYGTYSKPSTGIPKTDLASNVQTSLDKADTALQSHQDILAVGTDIEIGRYSSVLPPEYQQVEYLQSSGTQLIDLGVKWSYNISTITICEMLSSNSSPALGCVGARNSTSVVWGNYNAVTTNFACFGNKVNITFSQNMVDGAFHSWKTDNSGFYLDDVQKADLSGSNSALVSNDNICLFGRYDGNGNVERTGDWRIKSHQTYNNGVLVQNLIPASRRADGTLGMYDTVTDTFFLNVGTGTFRAGENVGDALTIRFTNDSGFTSNTGTITGITMNGVSKGTSGVVNLGTVLTEHQTLKTINNESIVGTGNLTISGLPTVTASDNGKILLVVNGAWALVTPTAT